ncbi:peroxiredoxin-like family protein [Nonlabens tegetincola]|uniref:peroxiredoxin-like family protein n=1 Tax=Nonlabens tegetincola TaxID=323273 RepID=UPI0030C89AE9
MKKPIPQQQAPELSFPLLGDKVWDLKKAESENFTLVIFYRGLHCPLCKKYLEQLNELLSDFEDKGVQAVAVSMDDEKRARLSKQKWDIDKVSLGYNLSEESARNWGLYLSKGIKEGEPDLFSEPGLFLVDSHNDIYYAAINSNPWGRPHLPSMLKAIDFILDKEYPARGEMM